MKMRSWIQVSVAAWIATTGFVQAEEASTNEVVRTGEIVVSATRTERLRSEVPVSVAIVPEHEIRKKPAQSVLEVLRDIPGVTVADNGGNGLKYIRIRGESTRRTLILLDGQPLSQQKSMEGAMPFIGKNQIERIEVVKGPSSVLYGSEAIGGVINIITKKGGDKPISGGLSTTYDSSNKGWRQDYDVRGNMNGIEYAVSYGNYRGGDTRTATRTLDSNGYNAKNPSKYRLSGTGSESDEYSLYLGYKTNNIHAGVRYDHHDMNYEVFSDEESELPFQDGTMNIPNSTREKYSAFLELTDLTEHFRKLKFDVYHQKTVRDFDIYIDMFMQMPDFGLTPTPIPFPPFTMYTPYSKGMKTVMDYTIHTRTHNEQVTDGGTVQGDWEFGDHYVILGGTLQNDDIDGTTKTRRRYGDVLNATVHVPASDFNPISNPTLDPINFNATPYEHFVYDAEMLTAAAFVQDEWRVMDKTRLIGGARYTYVDSQLHHTDDPDITSGITENDSQDGNMAFSLGAVHQAASNLTLRASYSQGYRHPNLAELYTGAPAHGDTAYVAGNANLDPETSQSFELGALYQGEHLFADVAVFYTEAKDYITDDLTEYINVGGADTMGAELSVAYEILETGLSPYLGLTWLRREYDYGSSHAVTSTRDSGVADWTGRCGLRYWLEVSASSSMSIDLFGRFSDDAALEESDGERHEENGWGTANFEVSYLLDEFVNMTETLPISLEVYAGIYNIFDKDYTPLDELQAAGRHAAVGLNLTF